VGNRVVAGYKQDAERAYEHAQSEKYDRDVVAALLHTNNPRPYYRQKSKRP